MTTKITTLTKKQAQAWLANFDPRKVLPTRLQKALKDDGWKLKQGCMIKRYKDYFLYMEFCIGDFCTYPGSKKTGWLLEQKVRNATFFEALVSIAELQERIDNGEHWTGEED